MIRNRANLEQYALALQARGGDDLVALAELCQTRWELGQQAEAIETFCRLLDGSGAVRDSAFDTFYLAGLRATNTCPTPLGRRDRLIKLIEILQSCSQIDGDVVECGCFRGLSSYMMCSYLQAWDSRFDGTRYHIFDSFEGLSEPTEDDEIPAHWENASALRAMSKRGNFAASRQKVAASLRAFPRISYHEGWIPLSFQGLPNRSYRFVHIDVDLYDPTLDACNYFYSRLSPGGVMVSDDYSWPGARTALEDFCSEHGARLELTGFGQAVIRNRCNTW